MLGVVVRYCSHIQHVADLPALQPGLQAQISILIHGLTDVWHNLIIRQLSLNHLYNLFALGKISNGHLVQKKMT
jgi:hypothetical protein